LFSPFILALLVVFLMEPLVGRLSRHISRRRAAIMIILLFLMTTGGFVAMLLPLLLGEASDLMAHVPHMVQVSERWLAAQLFFLRESMGFELPDLMNWMRDHASSLFTQSFGALGTSSQWLASAVSTLLTSLINVILVPIFAVTASIHADTLKKELSTMIPNSPFLHRFLNEVERVFAGYFRGQFMVSLIVGTLAWLGLWAIGMPWPFLLGMAIGVFNIIPLIGPSSMFLLASLIVCFQPDPWYLWLKMAAVFLSVQTMESFFISPRILGRTVGIHPVIALAALFFFGSMFGPFGLVLAIPLAALLLFLWRNTRPDGTDKAASTQEETFNSSDPDQEAISPDDLGSN
jgi:predicted PurR-regulated permease PerM